MSETITHNFTPIIQQILKRSKDYRKPLKQFYIYLDSQTQRTFRTLGGKGGTYREIFEKYLKEKNIVHETVLEAWSIEIVKQSLVLGMGISILPKISVLNELREGSLVYENAKIDKKNTIYSQLIYHKNKKVTKELQELIKLVDDLKQRTLIK